MMIILALTIAASLAPPSTPPLTANVPSTPNPRAIEFIERDSAVRAWALAHHDRNRDGWLTSYEASAAAEAFRDIADEDRNGRLTVREYEGGVAFVRVRY